MPRTRRRRVARPLRPALASVGLAAVLAACGGQAASESSTAGADDTAAVGSPLEQLLSGNQAGTRAFEDAVAACMRERGWEYTPDPRSAMGMGRNVVLDSAFLEEYGFGITTQPPLEAIGGQDGSRDDPNQRYVNSLSAADQERYHRDLWGEMETATAGADGAAAVMPDPGACSTKAQEAVGQEYPELSNEFAARLGELFQTMEEDPAMVAAVEDWSDCMEEAGFAYDDPRDIFTDLLTRSAGLVGGGAPVAVDGAGAPAAATGANGSAGSPGSLAPADQERLATLQDEERAIAKADAECRASTVDPVREDLEQEVIEKLRSEFPGLGGGR